MVAVAHPERNIPVTEMDEETLLAERDELLKHVDYASVEALFEHVRQGDYTVEERVAAERFDSIAWLLSQDEC